MTEETKEPLIGKTLEELRTLARELGMPAFVGGQIARWLYVQHVKDINEMANISKKHRELLAQRFTVGCHAPIDAQYSKDGTIKYLFPVYAGASKEKLRHEFVETVYIPDGDRATLCVSSQVGCKMNCLFCQTGKQGFEGSLTAADILNQVYALPDVDKLTNIVFMGQGEPMDNLDTCSVPRRSSPPTTVGPGLRSASRSAASAYARSCAASSTRATATWPSASTPPSPSSVRSSCQPNEAWASRRS